MESHLMKLNYTARILVEEARRRGYEVKPVPRSSKSYGSPVFECKKKNKKIYFRGTVTNLNKSLSRFLAHDKITTNEILRTKKLPIPETLVIKRENTPVKSTLPLRTFLKQHRCLVVKPSDTDHGHGITLGIKTMKNLIDAISYAMEESDTADVLIQRQVPGQEFRFLVLEGQVIFVANRQPPFVVGDGKNTVRELVEIKNADPRRGNDYLLPMAKIDFDEITRFIESKILESIPSKGEKIQLLGTSNLSRGGESTNCTKLALNFLKDVAIKAAEACDLGIAGVDIVTTDIEKGNTKNSFVLEVNVSPGLGVTADEIDAAKLIIDELEKI
jgi:D-alanine-D-alanine ligase-like ATP-grasp enzyme